MIIANGVDKGKSAYMAGDYEVAFEYYGKDELWREGGILMMYYVGI